MNEITNLVNFALQFNDPPSLQNGVKGGNWHSFIQINVPPLQEHFNHERSDYHQRRDVTYYYHSVLVACRPGRGAHPARVPP